jgi:uncharacterized protein YqkB
MFISFSASAVRKLSPYLEDGSAKLKFLYDTEGCGCGMSGVPALQLVSSLSTYDREAQGEPFAFYYEPHHEVFYNEPLRIDYNESAGSFSLSGDSQIYTKHLRFISKSHSQF